MPAAAAAQVPAPAEQRRPRRHRRPRARAARGAARRQAADPARARPAASCWAAPGTSARTTRSLGDAERWFAQRDLTGWTAVGVPHNWNATDLALEQGVGRLVPQGVHAAAERRARSASQLWKVRFEGSNYRTHGLAERQGDRRASPATSRSRLDLAGLRKGRNTLVVKVSSLRSRTDLTHWRPAAFNGYGTGGWWNFGGLLREVYVRPVDTVDIEDVHVAPAPARLRGPARVEVRAALRNLSRRGRARWRSTLRVRGPALDSDQLKPQRLPADASRELARAWTSSSPRLWQPGRPALYSLRVSAATDEGERRCAPTGCSFGVRSSRRRARRALLNGRRLNLRGASIHEDDIRTRAARSRQGTRALLVSRLRDLGATVTRSHYPLHPAFLEAFDRAGILYWVAGARLPDAQLVLRPPGVRGAATRGRAHGAQQPEPPVDLRVVARQRAGRQPLRARRDRRRAADATSARAPPRSRELDDTRLIAIDRQSRIGEPLSSPAYRYLDVLGVNEYFGWYASVAPTCSARRPRIDELGPYLDELHAPTRRSRW